VSVFLADFFPYTLQTLPVVMVVNYLTWRNFILMTNAFTSPTCSLCAWRGLLFGLWVSTLNPDISCYDTGEEVTVVADYVQQFLAQHF